MNKQTSFHITIVAGARPNFMKVAPIIEELEKRIKEGLNATYFFVHTGQHYDEKMSGSFFQELGIPSPHVNLEVGSGSQSKQTADIMMSFEEQLAQNPTDLVLVVGDVTSTMACAIVAKKMGVLLAHVEGGIRSYDMQMPEEINRKVTDSITDIFFTTSSTAGENLVKEGVDPSRIYFTGNVMIDTLLKNIPRLKAPQEWELLGLEEKQYFILTLHRPSNVDHEEHLRQLLHEINVHTAGKKVVFPVHPRTKKMLEQGNIVFPHIHYISPLGYLGFNYLVKNSFAVITDSGGITEETTVMNIPCITLRDTTERPETCDIGTNVLAGTRPESIAPLMQKLHSGEWKKGGIPPLWDGKAAVRIVDHLIDILNRS